MAHRVEDTPKETRSSRQKLDRTRLIRTLQFFEGTPIFWYKLAEVQLVFGKLIHRGYLDTLHILGLLDKKYDLGRIMIYRLKKR